MTGSFPEAPTACPSCGQPVPTEKRFCDSCGYDLGEPEYVCPSCAGTVALAERHCRHCGFDFEATEPVEESTETAVAWTTARETAVEPATARPVLGPCDPVTGVVLASWGSRAGAWLIDLLILGTVLVILAFVEGSSGYGLVLFATALYLGPPLYFWLLIGARGQTLGKMALGIHVRRSEDAGRVSYARALGRAASAVLLGLFFFPILLSYFWPLWDGRNQTLHDKMSGTIVVRS